jgi:hypothetical protein
MQIKLQAVIPLYWKGGEIPAGGIVTADRPDDDDALEYWAKFGARGAVGDDSGPGPPEPPTQGGESEGEAGQERPGRTQPMSTSDAPAAVGRRQRDK